MGAPSTLCAYDTPPVLYSWHDKKQLSVYQVCRNTDKDVLGVELRNFTFNNYLKVLEFSDCVECYAPTREAYVMLVD